MGAIERVKCENCGSAWECRTGCGILHGRLENVLLLFSEKVREEVNSVTSQEKFPKFLFNFEAACCDTCRAYVSVPILELPDQRRRFIGECPACHEQVSEPESTRIIGKHKHEKLRCPICQKDNLQIQKVGIWD